LAGPALARAYTGELTVSAGPGAELTPGRQWEANAADAVIDEVFSPRMKRF
jgi:hypothetical protein